MMESENPEKLKEILDLYEDIETFELSDRFSEPMHNYYYNLRSLIKYWVLTRDIITNQIYKNINFFSANEDDGWSNVNKDFLENTENIPIIDGEEIEHDFSMIPSIQKNLIICSSLSLIETLLKNVCKEIDEEYELNGKGSYIQQFNHYIKSRTNISMTKQFLKDFETFGHMRNSFIHQLDNRSIPIRTVNYLNSMTGPFSDINNGISNIHVELCLKLLGQFGSEFQKQYWDEFDRTKLNK
jgi:hypothetical protein